MKLLYGRLMATFFVACLCSPFTVLAQKVKTVAGEYTYVAPFNVSPSQAKMVALEQAKLQAIADEFGTVISQFGGTIMRNDGSVATVKSRIYSSSEVKGEWIETIGDPSFDITTSDDMLIVKARVKGKAREIVSAPIDIKVKLLRNGTDDKFEDDDFHDGDDLYISFISPLDGFLAVYLVDDDEQAWCLLPYRNQLVSSYAIERGKRYVLGSKDMCESSERSFVDEYYITCSRSQEFNRIFVIFSPEEFTKAIDILGPDGKLPRQLSFNDFNRWLVNNRKHDVKMTLRVIPITINKSE